MKKHLLFFIVILNIIAFLAISAVPSISGLTPSLVRSKTATSSSSTSKTAVQSKKSTLSRKSKQAKPAITRSKITALTGLCCKKTKLIRNITKSECEKVGGYFYKNQAVFKKLGKCLWCCTKENTVQPAPSRSQCNGSMHTSFIQATNECKPEPKGYCNAKGRTLPKITEKKCVSLKGLFFTRKLDAQKNLFQKTSLAAKKTTYGGKNDIKAQKAGTPKAYVLPKLEVKLFSGDFEKYGKHWTDTKTQSPLTFRWSHAIDGFNAVMYKVYRGYGPQDEPLLFGGLQHIPEKNKSSIFHINFWPLIADDHGYPQNYTVKLVFSKYNVATMKFEEFISSNEVKITFVKGADSQTFTALPTLYVNINKIEILDDSDDLSDGEFGFAFWLTYGNGGKTGYQYFNGSKGTGESFTTNINLSLETPPQWVTIHGYGFDDDETEWVPIGPFIMILANECGALASPGGGDCPGDSASGQILIDSGMGVGNKKATQSFSFYASGGSLRFKVYGSYELK